MDKSSFKPDIRTTLACRDGAGRVRPLDVCVAHHATAPGRGN